MKQKENLWLCCFSSMPAQISLSITKNFISKEPDLKPFCSGLVLVEETVMSLFDFVDSLV